MEGSVVSTEYTGCDTIRVFDAEPDLLAGLDERTAEVLRLRVTVPRLWIEPGPWFPPEGDGTRALVGLLVLDGLIIRTLQLRGRTCPELLGPGDLLRPWDEPVTSIEHERSYFAHERTTLAVLDGSFAALGARWPSIYNALLARTSERTRSLAFTLALVHMRRAEERLTTCLWHFADRWGRVTPDGVHLPLRLTHELLAQLTCMRRPTASSALRSLCDRGDLARCRDGTWILRGDPNDGSLETIDIAAAV